ncbi:unnamed protein product [Musa acuminata var. zebrina]
MENLSTWVLCFLVLLLLSGLSPVMPASPDASPIDREIKDADASKLRTYIIRMRLPENATFASTQALENWYRSLLPPIAANSSVARFVYAYSDAITGFAARLTEEELGCIEQKEGFLASYQDVKLPLLTTHTPELLGLQPGQGLWSNSNMGKGVIIGVLDTGLAIGHPSFGDDGMEPPPSRWKGNCPHNGIGCNNKVIGVRIFTSSGGGLAPEGDADDEVGHGTHTSSTAVGNFVKNANVLGSGNGTAAGVAPRAHLSIYKVCSSDGCITSDVLAGMDTAIKDGVDVLSLSLGGGPRALYADVIAIGAFSAIEKGIFVSCAGGNSGPSPSTLSNEAPWILTVGATTIDRNIRATVKLGNGLEFDGETAFQPANFSSTMLPLVMPSSSQEYRNCLVGVVMPEVKGKMVVCQRALGSRIQLGETVKTNGGAAMLIINGELDGYTTLAEAHVLPASHLNYVNGSSIEKYVNTSKEPVASITFKGTILGVSPSPTISFFSSRGPNSISPGILKPDVVGPGVNILAAWPFEVGPSPNNSATVFFNMISGTSMSTPHLSGTAALIKSVHPDWSPAAIKSAIMTTSDIVANDGKPITDELHQPATFFATGTGHVNPTKAADPGLLYDLNVDDYIGYLCGLGYSDAQVEIVTHRRVTCDTVKKIKDVELNYPAIVITAAASFDNITVNRTVTCFCSGKTVFKLKVDKLSGVSAKVSPETLEFSHENEKKTYSVSLSWQSSNVTDAEGNLWWVSDMHSVRIPIVVRA